jgi:hypothetical protein
MEIVSQLRKLLELWIYMPGIVMITLGSCVLLFPQLLPAVLAGFFILSGLLLIRTTRRLRMVATQMRNHLELQREESLEPIPYGLLPNKVYTSWIN